MASVYMDPPAPEYDPAHPRGGDPLNSDVNAQYAGLEYHYVYLAIMGFLVWIIVPGIGLLYAGLAKRKSSLALLFQTLSIIGVTVFTWMFWGYSLAFSRTGNAFIGDLASFGLRNVLVAPSPGSSYQPEVVFCLYQMLFCACTIMLVIGGAFERGRILPSLIFAFFWITIVYAPIANWTWNANGWLYNLPSLDFAGGGPVHQSSGWSALAYALMLGKRSGPSTIKKKPHNVTLVFLGTCLIWFGWFGFNGGSALNASLRSMVAAFNTNTAAGTGCLGWIMVDYIRNKGKFSLVGACEGVIAGLVGITPAAGYVSLWIAALIGFLTGIICALCQDVNKWLRIDDGLEVFKLHAIGGMVGSFLTGIFAQEWVSALDGVSRAPGGIDGVGVQVGKQLAEITAIACWAFAVTCLLLLPFKFMPWLGLRVSDEAELNGLDRDQFIEGEQIGDWTFFEDQETGAITTHGLARHNGLSSNEGTSTPNSLEKQPTMTGHQAGRSVEV